jgi:hypothetical protein
MAWIVLCVAVLWLMCGFIVLFTNPTTMDDDGDIIVLFFVLVFGPPILGAQVLRRFFL